MAHQSDLIDCGTITTHSGKVISVKVRDDSYAPCFYVAADGLRDGSDQPVNTIDDMRSPGFSHTPVAKQILARGATHAVVVGYGKTAIIIAVDEDVAAHLKGIKAEASRRAKAVEVAKTVARWDAAERACPAGYAPAKVEWTNGDLCARGVVTRDGIKATVSDMDDLHDGYAWVPTAEIEANRAKAQADEDSRLAEAAVLASVKVPAAAIKAYDRYRGDAERAWEREDEHAWSLIRRYGAAIEAQDRNRAQPVISQDE